MSRLENKLENKVAIITGGAGGPNSLGSTIVRRLHAEGAKIVIAGFNEESGEALARELGNNAIYLHSDITQDSDIKHLINTTIEKFGRLDYLINNACTYAESGLDSTREEWLKLLEINTVGPALLAKAALSALKKTKGVIINFSSVSGKIAQTGMFAYSVSKAANLHLTKRMAAELAPFGIRVNCVSPGWTWSDPIAMATDGDIDKADRLGAKMHPLGRVGRGEDVANAIIYLCSDDASFVTGTDIPVDGGYGTLGPEQTISPFDWLAGD